MDSAPGGSPPAGDREPVTAVIPSTEDRSASAFPRQPTTDEGRWAEWAVTLPEAGEVRGPVVVVAPHPDDETLGCGGTIGRLRGHCTPVRVVTVTDGEGSHPGTPDLGRLRRAEQRTALAVLGVDEPAVHLGLPDGGVADRVDELTDALVRLCAGAATVLAPWPREGHTDHDACGRAATAAAAQVGAAVRYYLVWTWQWATVNDLDGSGFGRIDLASDERSAKVRAAACFPSQTTDALGRVILDEVAVARAARSYEVLSGGG